MTLTSSVALSSISFLHQTLVPRIHHRCRYFNKLIYYRLGFLEKGLEYMELICYLYETNLAQISFELSTSQMLFYLYAAFSFAQRHRGLPLRCILGLRLASYS